MQSWQCEISHSIYSKYEYADSRWWPKLPSKNPLRYFFDLLERFLCNGEPSEVRCCWWTWNIDKFWFPGPQAALVVEQSPYTMWKGTITSSRKPQPNHTLQRLEEINVPPIPGVQDGGTHLLMQRLWPRPNLCSLCWLLQELRARQVQVTNN